MLSFVGKTDSTHSKGVTGTVSIHSGTLGSETDTTADMTGVYNRYADVAGVPARIARINSRIAKLTERQAAATEAGQTRRARGLGRAIRESQRDLRRAFSEILKPVRFNNVVETTRRPAPSQGLSV